MGLNHPVAFIDAWADDLANEPLVALAATLEKALEPFAETTRVKETLGAVVANAGQVLKIAGKGLARRGIGLVIGATATDQLEDVLSEVTKSADDIAADQAPLAGQGITEDIANKYRGVSSSSLMKQRLADFREGQDAVEDMKVSLAALVEVLREGNMNPPIFIIVDELDRCRPTYAVKLLEEIKHLFDVPGLVFVSAMNARQLSHSVSGAYGHNFDGRSYLARFIDREYRLATPDLDPLLARLCALASLQRKQFQWSNVVVPGKRDVSPGLPEMIASYMRLYGLSARDAFKIVDILQTCQALSTGVPLIFPYLMPLIVGHLQGLPKGQLPSPVEDIGLGYARRGKTGQDSWEEFSFEQAAHEFETATRLTDEQLDEEIKKGGSVTPAQIVRMTRPYHGRPDITAIERYPDLILSVARFANPSLEG